MVVADRFGSCDPAARAGTIIGEPRGIHSREDAAARRHRGTRL